MENNPKIPEVERPAYDDEMVDLLLHNPEEYFRRRKLELDESHRTKESEANAGNERHVTALDTAARQEINGRAVFSVPAIIRGFKARRR